MSRNHLNWAGPTIDLTTKAIGVLPESSVPQIDLATKAKGILAAQHLPSSVNVSYLEIDGGDAASSYAEQALQLDMGAAQ